MCYINIKIIKNNLLFLILIINYFLDYICVNKLYQIINNAWIKYFFILITNRDYQYNYMINNWKNIHEININNSLQICYLICCIIEVRSLELVLYF